MKRVKLFSFFVFFVLLSNRVLALPVLDVHEYAISTSGTLLTNTTLAEVDILIQDGFTTVYEENYTTGAGNAKTTDGFAIFQVHIGDGTGTPQGVYSLSDYTTLAMSRTLYAIVRIKVNSTDPYRVVSRKSVWTLAYQNGGADGSIGGTISNGQVAFGTGAGTIGGDNNLFWDNTNSYLGVGTTSPKGPFHVVSDNNNGVFLQYPSSTGFTIQSYWPTLALNLYWDVNEGWRAIGDGYTGMWMQNPGSGVMSFAIKGNSSVADEIIGNYFFEKMVIKPNGNVGIGTTNPTATLDINGSTGYNQLRLRINYTPTGSGDTNGNVGDISWDDNYIYVKTNTGWKRAALSLW